MYNHLDKSPETYTEWKQLVSNGFILYHSVYMTFLKWQKFQEFERISRIWASLVAQRVKHLPAMRETWVWSLGWEDPLGKDMATPLQYSCLENPMNGGAWWAIYRPWGHRESDMTERLHLKWQNYGNREHKNISACQGWRRDRVKSRAKWVWLYKKYRKNLCGDGNVLYLYQWDILVLFTRHYD